MRAARYAIGKINLADQSLWRVIQLRVTIEFMLGSVPDHADAEPGLLRDSTIGPPCFLPTQPNLARTIAGLLDPPRQIDTSSCARKDC